MYLPAILLCPFRRAGALLEGPPGVHTCRRSFHQGEILPEILQTLRAAEERGEIG